MKIDSLTKFDELIATKMDPAQARALAHSLAAASAVDLSVVADKEDLRHLEEKIGSDLRSEMKDLSTELRLDITELRTGIKYILRGTILFGTLTFSAIAILLVRSFS